ncbi:hypothetical protein E1B28_002066 [Marasmius oreades]|uniref:AB hydrolase-1 domain-containing protein n=1 Tax=Marasmius oreades TaxID=181124 RepID=A0A9P7V4X0_9AGAR|nr:uncharacterized protein E1B28_002066 [Marasmius oreades]KAG7100293.1 hypothetical protein E1B28_002066 [Marasmius oreades]
MKLDNQTYTLSENIKISFTDNGSPSNSDDYTTLVILHGSAFNGYGLEKLHHVSHSLNLRTVILQRRQYPGSTQYTDSELEDLRQGRKVFLDRIGKNMAEFLLQFIEKEKIPKASEDMKRGGIAVMAWSMGTPSATALFSDRNIVPRKDYLVLEDYVKDLIFDDPPYLCFGFKLPDDHQAYDPWTDPELKTLSEKFEQFSNWATSYFDHPNPETGKLQDMDLTTKGSSNATILEWSPEELQKYFNMEAAVSSEFPMVAEPMQKTLREMVERVLYDENLIHSYFPRVKVTVVHCSQSPWHSYWCAKELQRTYDERLSKGGSARPLKIYKVVGNHMLHWAAPKLLLEATVEGMRR